MAVGDQTSEKRAMFKADVRGKTGEIPDWRRQDENAVRSIDALCEYLPLSSIARNGAEQATGLFRMKITPYYLGLVDPNDPNCPIAKMVVPDIRELTIRPNEREDPTGDENRELNHAASSHAASSRQPVPRLVHRYPDRALLLTTTRCGTYCRHCFRRRLAGRADQTATEFEMSSALKYIKTHDEIREVILSGGDPLMLSDDALFSLLSRLKRIPHVRVLRIHSRMPVVNPYRITDALAEGLARFRPLWLVLHTNHPREVTPFAEERWRRLAEFGIPILNQAVLLKGVNDDAETLKALGWRLIESGVMPYYLHHPDLARGTGHLRVSVRRGLSLLRALQGVLPGYAIPRYILDTPGGYGKVPLQHAYLNERKNGGMSIETPGGQCIAYSDGGIE